MAKVTKVATTVTLELSGEEAGVLRSVLLHTGGDLKKFLCLANRVGGALADAGIAPISTMSGVITFDGDNNES